MKWLWSPDTKYKFSNPFYPMINFGYAHDNSYLNLTAESFQAELSRNRPADFPMVRGP